MPVWNDKMTVHQAARGQVSLNSYFTWMLPLSNAYQFCSSNVWVFPHHSVHVLNMSIIVFVYLGLQCKWNQLSWNNSRQTSAVCPLGYQWTDCTGRPLEPQVQWDVTGTTLADASTQWHPSDNSMHNWNTMDHHWKTTGRTLETHWLPTITSPEAFQCTLGSKLQAHWIATGLPLHYNWLSVRDVKEFHGLWNHLLPICLFQSSFKQKQRKH